MGSFKQSLNQDIILVRFLFHWDTQDRVFLYRYRWRIRKECCTVERIHSSNEAGCGKASGKTPAYAVMRRAIANAPYYRTQVTGFTAETYLKGTGKVTSIPAVLKLSKEVRTESKKMLGKLFLLEEQRKVTFKAPNIWKDTVKAVTVILFRKRFR